MPLGIRPNGIPPVLYAKFQPNPKASLRIGIPLAILKCGGGSGVGAVGVRTRPGPLPVVVA